MMPKGSDFCAECGAPLDDAPGVGGSDAEVYPELAKANLMRMRKEFKQAEDICLGILRRYPNNASANTLLGDICYERGDLEQAAEWYELALDILPDSAADKAKLTEVRAKLSEKQKAETVETLGITHASKPPYVTIAAVVLALCIVGVGVAVSLKGNQEPKVDTDASRPIVFEDKDKGKDRAPVVNPNPQPQQEFIKDPELAAKVAQQLNLEEGRLLHAEVGDRDKTVVVTYLLKDDPDWIMRAKIIRASFANAPAGTPSVTINLLRDFKVTESNYVSREKYDQSNSPEWQQLSGGTDEAVVELFFGHKMETPTPTPVPTDPNQSGTPPIGEGQTSPPNQGTEGATEPPITSNG